MIPITIPANQKVLQYLTARNPAAPLLAAPNGTFDPYFGLGSHAELVEHLWRKLDPSLPLDCCWVVCGTPGLVHPVTGELFAFTLGTLYLLRLPSRLVAEAISLGARITTTWAGGQQRISARNWGGMGSFGRNLPKEPEWLNQV